MGQQNVKEYKVIINFKNNDILVLVFDNGKKLFTLIASEYIRINLENNEHDFICENAKNIIRKKYDISY